MARGQHHQPLPLGGEERTATDVECASGRLGNCCEGGIKFMNRCSLHDQNPPPKGFAGGLYRSQFPIGVRKIRVQQHGDDGRLGNQLVQQPQPLGRRICRYKGYARNIAARPIEVGNQTNSDRVVAGDEYDRRCSCCRLGNQRGLAVANDHRGLTTDQIGHQPRKPVELTVRKAVFDGDILALDKTGPGQALPECGDEVRRVGGRCDAQEADHRHRRLLRQCRHRPRSRAANQSQKIPPPHALPSVQEAVSYRLRRAFCYRALNRPWIISPYSVADVRFSNRPVEVKRFQTIHTAAVSMSPAGSCFSPESAPRPFHHGIRRRGGTIFGTALPSV